MDGKQRYQRCSGPRLHLYLPQEFIAPLLLIQIQYRSRYSLSDKLMVALLMRQNGRIKSPIMHLVRFELCSLETNLNIETYRCPGIPGEHATTGSLYNRYLNYIYGSATKLTRLFDVENEARAKRLRLKNQSARAKALAGGQAG
jgi:hypothetical protein